MILIAVIDDRGGMLFNHRRQSRDFVLRERVLRLTEGGVLWMNAYSAGQFADARDRIRVSETFTADAAEGEYCFLETEPPSKSIERAEKLVLYRWNRLYPADRYFDVDPEAMGWRLVGTEDFCGSSHERITEEVYER